MLDHYKAQPLRMGCDLIEISRIESLIKKYSCKFINKILTPQERLRYPQNPMKQSAFLAKRFAAKEAFAKALGTGFGSYLHFHDIEILSHHSGQPYFVMCVEKLKKFHINTMTLSLSDERHYAMAVCVLQ